MLSNLLGKQPWKSHSLNSYSFGENGLRHGMEYSWNFQINNCREHLMAVYYYTDDLKIISVMI